MTVKMTGAVPVKQKDGSWRVVTQEREVDIPDLGREHQMCNLCGFSTYPECMKYCKTYLPNDSANAK